MRARDAGKRGARTAPETSLLTRVMIGIVGVAPTDLRGPAFAADRARYSTMGFSVCVTAAFAFFAMTSALSLANGFTPGYLVFGLLWALFIFGMDRSIVSSVDYGTGWQRRLRGVGLTASRLLIAVLIGLSISVPMEMLIFRKEVAVEFDRMKGTEQQQSIDAIRGNPLYDATTTPEYAELTSATAARDRAQQKVDDADAALDRELNGDGGSGTAGDGPRSRERKQDLAEKKKALASAETAVAEAQKRYDARVVERADARGAAEKSVIDELATRTAGLIDRARALHALAASDLAVSLVQWLVRALILLIDISPVLLKMISPPTVHDRSRRLRADSATRLTAFRTAMEELVDRTQVQARAAVDVATIETEAGVELDRTVRKGDLAVRRIRSRHAQTVEKEGLMGRTVRLVRLLPAVLTGERTLQVIEGGRAQGAARHRTRRSSR